MRAYGLCSTLRTKAFWIRISCTAKRKTRHRPITSIRRRIPGVCERCPNLLRVIVAQKTHDVGAYSLFRTKVAEPSIYFLIFDSKLLRAVKMSARRSLPVPKRRRFEEAHKKMFDTMDSIDVAEEKKRLRQQQFESVVPVAIKVAYRDPQLLD